MTAWKIATTPMPWVCCLETSTLHSTNCTVFLKKECSDISQTDRTLMIGSMLSWITLHAIIISFIAHISSLLKFHWWFRLCWWSTELIPWWAFLKVSVQLLSCLTRLSGTWKFSCCSMWFWFHFSVLWHVLLDMEIRIHTLTESFMMSFHIVFTIFRHLTFQKLVKMMDNTLG